MVARVGGTGCQLFGDVRQWFYPKVHSLFRETVFTSTFGIPGIQCMLREKQKMKVAFCTREDTDVSGGQNTWLCRFVPALKQFGIESQVLCFSLSREELPTMRAFRKAGIQCTKSCDKDRKYTEQRVRWILRQLAVDPPDVFVSNMVIPEAYYAGRWLREAGIPTVGVCHGGGMAHLYPGLLDEFVFGADAYRVSAFVTVSAHLEQEVQKRDAKNILLRRIPCGVPVPKNTVPKPSGRLRLVYAGQLVEERKRISEVTRALCRAVREVEGTEAFIYGDGPDSQAVAQIIRNEGDGLPIHLVGFVENDQIRKELQNCHAVVLLSDHEGLGLALLEGMACGVVPIGLRAASGLTEFVIDNRTGLLASDRGAGFIAEVRRLRKDPVLWQRLSRGARTIVQKEYSDEICVARWQELFREVLNSSGPQKPLRVPSRLRLPAVHPAFDELDKRAPRLRERAMRRLQTIIRTDVYQLL